jgi:hypothetical protein
MVRPWLALLGSLVLGAPLAAAKLPVAPHALQLAAVPERPAKAMTGSQFLRRTDGWPEAERQAAALAELERGNMPRSLSRLQPVTLRYQPPKGSAISATIWVTPDYLAIGPDEDYLYIPLTRPTAVDVARHFGCVLPTPRMVDAIYRQARAHLEPQPLPAGPQMRSNAYYGRHQKLIAAQRVGIPLGTLISGHKKDLVLTNRLLDRPDRVAIYGWHRSDGHPIQPLSTVHGVRYADYSHGVRLVWHEVSIDGVRRSIYDVLADPMLAPVLSDEGALRDLHALMAPPDTALAGVDGASRAQQLAAPLAH